jgi:hypothetical protein
MGVYLRESGEEAVDLSEGGGANPARLPGHRGRLYLSQKFYPLPQPISLLDGIEERGEGVDGGDDEVGIGVSRLAPALDDAVPCLPRRFRPETPRSRGRLISEASEVGDGSGKVAVRHVPTSLRG